MRYRIKDRVSTSDLREVGVADHVLPESVIHLRMSFGVFPQLLVMVVQGFDDFSVQARMLGRRTQAVLYCTPVVI